MPTHSLRNQPYYLLYICFIPIKTLILNLRTHGQLNLFLYCVYIESRKCCCHVLNQFSLFTGSFYVTMLNYPYCEKHHNPYFTYFTNLSCLGRSKESVANLRIRDSYDAKIANTCNLWTLWNVIQLIRQIYSIKVVIQIGFAYGHEKKV